MYIFFLPLIHQDYIGEQRQVKQFHFTAWPDMGLPESPTPLIAIHAESQRLQSHSDTGTDHCTLQVRAP